MCLLVLEVENRKEKENRNPIGKTQRQPNPRPSSPSLKGLFLFLSPARLPLGPFPPRLASTPRGPAAPLARPSTPRPSSPFPLHALGRLARAARLRSARARHPPRFSDQPGPLSAPSSSPARIPRRTLCSARAATRCPVGHPGPRRATHQPRTPSGSFP